MGGEIRGHTRLSSLPDDPVELFTAWHERAAAAPEVQYPSAMCLSTVSARGRPQGRFVIAHPQPDGTFIFLTDAGSPKARGLAVTPFAALTGYWGAPLEQQVRVEGAVSAVDSGLADEIFVRRPRASQLTHFVSRQSRPVTLVDLADGLDRLEAELGDDEGPGRPEHWVGFRLEPESWEFWQARARRLHDRFLYTRTGDLGWSKVRLAP